MHARARAPAPDLFDRRRTQLSRLRAQHGLRNGYDTRPIVYLPYKRNNNNSNNNRERINNIIIFDSVHAIPSTAAVDHAAYYCNNITIIYIYKIKSTTVFTSSNMAF